MTLQEPKPHPWPRCGDKAKLGFGRSNFAPRLRGEHARTADIRDDRQPAQMGSIWDL